MKILESVRVALSTFKGSFINKNNEIILIPKFNVYTLLDDVETDDDFKVKLCEWISWDCCCSLRYEDKSKLQNYWEKNTKAFNTICGTSFSVQDMDTVYCYLGNGINRQLARAFVESNFNLEVLAAYTENEYSL